MDKKEKDMVVTTLRLPIHLHHKLTKISEIKDRSLQNLIIKTLQDYVSDIEQNIFSSYGKEKFDSIYKSIFGVYVTPYIDIKKSLGIAINPNDVLNSRGTQRSTESNTTGHGRIVPKPNTIFDKDEYKD